MLDGTEVRLISDTAAGLENISCIIGILAGVIWILSVVILIIVFSLVSNERKKEFAVLRVLGASRRMLFHILRTESLTISFAGALMGLLLAGITIFPVSNVLQAALGMPFLMMQPAGIAALCVGTLILSVLAGSRFHEHI